MLCRASEAAAALRTHERMDGCGMPPAMTGSFLGGVYGTAYTAAATVGRGELLQGNEFKSQLDFSWLLSSFPLSMKGVLHEWTWCHASPGSCGRWNKSYSPGTNHNLPTRREKDKRKLLQDPFVRLLLRPQIYAHFPLMGKVRLHGPSH